MANYIPSLSFAKAMAIAVELLFKHTVKHTVSFGSINEGQGSRKGEADVIGGE